MKAGWRLLASVLAVGLPMGCPIDGLNADPEPLGKPSRFPSAQDITLTCRAYL